MDIYFSLRLDAQPELIWASCDCNDVQNEMIADYLDSIADSLNVLMNDLKQATNANASQEIN